MAKWTPEAHDAAEQRLADIRRAAAETARDLSRADQDRAITQLAEGLDRALKGDLQRRGA